MVPAETPPPAHAAADDVAPPGDGGDTAPASAAAGAAPRTLGLPQSWTAQQVAQQLGSKAYEWADKKLVRKLAQRGVDGAALLGLTKRDLRDDFGIRELGRIKRILRGVDKLERGGPAASPRVIPSPPTPDAMAFDVPISEEDLVNTSSRGRGTTSPTPGDSDCDRTGYEPRPPQPPQRPPPPSPTPLAAAPHVFQSAFAEIDCDVDIIELEDLVPENRDTGGDEPREIPQRPVTAIGHRPADGEGMHENGHRHVWADDPAVHIRRASDLLHDRCSDDDELPPEVLRTLTDRDPNRPRPAPVPRPPASLGMARLPCGSRPPEWAKQSWGAPAAAADNPRRRPSAGAVAGAAAAVSVPPAGGGSAQGAPAARKATPHVIDINAPPYDHGILERERQFSDLQRLFTLWVMGDTDDESSSDHRFISYDCLRRMMTRYAGWAEGEVERNMAAVLSGLDGVQVHPVRLDWHDFFGIMTRVTSSMPPTAFDNIVAFFTNAINEQGATREEARRERLLAAVYAEMADGEDDAGQVLSEAKAHAVLEAVAHTAEPAVADLLRGELAALAQCHGTGAGGHRDAPVLSREEFVCLLGRALRSVPFSDFDLFIFRLKRGADAYTPSGTPQPALHARQPNPHLQQLTSDALEAIVGQSPATAPLVIMGSGMDPSVPIAECAASCGVALRLQFVSSDESGKAALQAIAAQGFSHGDWICLVLDAKYAATDRFLRSVGVKLQTEAPWPIHRKFRLWIYTSTVIAIPSILSMRSVLIDTEAFDLPSLLKDLRGRSE